MPPSLVKTFVYLREAVAWRLHRILGDRVVYGTLLASAKFWRRMLTRPVYIGVTGSAGKTTAKELLLGMLTHNAGARGVGNFSSNSNLEEIAKALLRLRPKDDYFVTELSGHRPGEMNRNLPLLQPSIGVVTVIRDDHSSKDYSREVIAQEKGKLIAALPATGTAVLNADDELVLAMATRSAAKVITYGLSPKAELRAEDISSVWPERLQMTVVRGPERVKLRTQLCGTHWVPSVLGAIGAGLANGMSLVECAEGISSVAPFDGRMQPVITPDGVTFIRDDFKAPLWTLDTCFEFMSSAQAKRKIMVFGEISDVSAAKGVTYKRTAIRAMEIADITIFVGPWALSALKARKFGEEEALRAFSHVRDATEYIKSITSEEDLVLLKGTNRKDHLERIILARNGEVTCWRDDCMRYLFCSECPDLNKSSGAPLLLHPQGTEAVKPKVRPSKPQVFEPGQQVIVGLGNPEARYSNTPHNIGYEVVDQLAASMALTWETTPEAWIARGSSNGRAIYLIKIRMPMNATGAGLKQLSESMAFGSEQCILVFDDLDLPLGAVKTRINGGAGGHRGVASILEAFQTDAIRRVKVGVGKAGGGLDRVSYVLTAFDNESRVAVDRSILTAETHVLKFMELPANWNQAKPAPIDHPETGDRSAQEELDPMTLLRP